MNAQVDGAELFYTTRGEGPPCLVPSNIGTVPYERQMPAALSDRLTLVFVDLRGAGRSTGDPAALTFDRVADDFEAVRAALDADRVAVLGHSILGVLAIEYGRRRPASVSHVITVGTPPHGDMRALAEQSTAFFEADAADDRKRRLRENLAALPAEASPGETMLAQTPMRFHDAGLEAAPLFEGAVSRPALFAHLLGTLVPGWNIGDDGGSLTVPLLLTHGRSDYVVPHHLWDGIPSTLPDATFQLFAESGHQPFVEEPDRFTAAVTAWMDGRR